MLWGKCGVNNVLSEFKTFNDILMLDKNAKPVDLVLHYKSLVGLLVSAREKAVLLCCLSLVYSATKLRSMFGINEDFLHTVKEKVIDYASQQSSVCEENLGTAEEKLTGTLHQLEKKIDEHGWPEI